MELFDHDQVLVSVPVVVEEEVETFRAHDLVETEPGVGSQNDVPVAAVGKVEVWTVRPGQADHIEVDLRPVGGGERQELPGPPGSKGYADLLGDVLKA